jgi:glucose-1-phosphate thymidylyltransferase
MLAGIREFCLITTQRDLSAYLNLLGHGEDFGIRITYEVQDQPNGIAESLLLAEAFLGNEACSLILGDNIFYGAGLGRELANFGIPQGSRILGYQVSNPEEFGVAILNESGKVCGIVEKPAMPTSNIAITGLYFFDNTAVERTKTLNRSARGELEITSLIQSYLDDEQLEFSLLPRGTAWLDTGTFDGLHKAASFVQVLESRTGLSIGNPYDVALAQGWIN